jgi:signal transduction histidine kinase
MIDKDGTFLLSEGKGLSKLGLKSGDVVGKSVYDLYKDFPAMLDKMKEAFNGESVKAEFKIGDYYFENWYSPQSNQKGEIISLLGLSVDITEQKKAEIKILQHQIRLKELANDLTISEEKIRKQIAIDLHDDVGQLLASMRMQMARITDMEENPELIVRMKSISQGLLKSVQATRAAIFDLSPPQLNEIGLVAATHDWMKEQIEQKHHIKTIISSDSEDFKLNENTTFLLFRSIKELMMNTVKHAKASQLTITFKRKDNLLEIAVEDDGVGFNYGVDLMRLKSDSYGLFSIQERISDLGGLMVVDSVIDKGTKIKLTVPLNGKRA